MDLLLLDIHGPVYWAMKFALNALALMAGAHFLDGVKIDDFVRAMIVAILLAVLNATLGNVLDFITTPLRFLTLGLFSFVVDAGLLLVAAYFLKGFHCKFINVIMFNFSHDVFKTEQISQNRENNTFYVFSTFSKCEIVYVRFSITNESKYQLFIYF